MQGFLFTDDDEQAITVTDFALRMRRAADAKEGRKIIKEHESAIHDEELRLGLEPTVGVMPWGYRGFSTLRPKELLALARRSSRCAELVRQGKEMDSFWSALLATELARYKTIGQDDAPKRKKTAAPVGQCRASNHCTLKSAPARIIGTPETAPYATIEPVGLDGERIYCYWDVVTEVLEGDRNFVRDDDDTDE